MSDLEQRVKALETKVKILEETLETLKNMQLSEQMDEYIQSKSKSLKLVNLINSMSAEQTLDFSKEEDSIQSVRATKNAIDQQIAAALRSSGDFSEQYPDDPRYFNYEIESGMVTDWNDRQKKDTELSKYIGKGIRITSYNGFESDRVIVPKEIDGYPVISIGENAFMNASFSELILPSSLKAILKNAFQGCTKLQHIDLPEGIEYLGGWCFSGAGLKSIRIPDIIKVIPNCCFYDCKDMESVVLGNRIRELDLWAVKGCQKLEQINLPETVQVIGECFENTAIKTLIIPSSVSKISNKVFGDDVLRRINNIVCVFLEKNTVIECGNYGTLCRVGQIYCLPGSNVQKFAREHSIPMNNYTESCMIDKADRWRGRNVWYLGRSVRYALKEVTTAQSSAERAEVSRGHSSRVSTGHLGEGPNQ